MTGASIHNGRGEAVRPAMALVTGGSRGVGAATVLALAEAGYDVAFTYRNKTRRAETVAAQAGEHGLRVLPLRCDITRSADLDLLFAQLAERREVLDLLVLSASGGLEADLVAADPQYPMRINRDAQAVDCTGQKVRIRRPRPPGACGADAGVRGPGGSRHAASAALLVPPPRPGHPRSGTPG